MPDKGIIVDSIDVSECEFLWKEKLPKRFCNNGNLDCDCNSNPNCKFKQLERYKQAIEEIFFCLIKENRKGTIKDTIWLNNYLTLWDYIAQILDIQGDQNEVENQIIQKCEEVSEFKPE